MRQKTVMVDPDVWAWLKEHRGAGSISELIQSLIKEYVKRRGTIPKKTEREELQEAVSTLQV